MASKIKGLSLALFALLAMGALAAQVAQAHVFKSDSANGRTVLTGEFDEGFKDHFHSTPPNFETVCSSAKFEGTQPINETETVTITPTYGSTTKPSGCEVVGVGEAIVHTNHCAYVFSGTTNAEGDAPVEIECEGASENKITITVPSAGATISIGAQKPSGGVHYTNAEVGGKKIVTIHSTVNNIHATCSPSIVCAFFGGTEQIEDYEGTDIIKGYEDTGTEATGTAKTTPSLAGSEGAQVNVSVNPGV